MTFMQIVTFTTTRLDEFRKLEQEWRAATTGRRTLLRDALYADRGVPAPLRRRQRVRLPRVGDGQLGAAGDLGAGRAGRGARRRAGHLHRPRPGRDRRRARRAGRAADDLPGDEPAHRRALHRGRGAGHERAAEPVPARRPRSDDRDAGLDAPHGRRFEEHSWVPTPDGFLLNWAWRTTAGEGHYSRGVAVVELAGTRIGRITVHCSGDWDSATEARQPNATAVSPA